MHSSPGAGDSKEAPDPAAASPAERLQPPKRVLQQPATSNSSSRAKSRHNLARRTPATQRVAAPSNSRLGSLGRPAGRSYGAEDPPPQGRLRGRPQLSERGCLKRAPAAAGSFPEPPLGRSGANHRSLPEVLRLPRNRGAFALPEMIELPTVFSP